MKQVAGVTDVTTDREQGGLQANVSIDRQAAARLGVRIQDIDNALNDAFSQRQISTIYTQRNQYRVILEVDRKYQRDPSDLTHVYVTGKGNTQVPLSEVAHVERSIAPLVVNHQGQFPSTTITYNLQADMPLEDVTAGTSSRRPWPHCTCRTRSTPNCRRRQSLRAIDRRAAVAHSRGAARGLYRARRTLQKPGAHR